jgi:hypothetical protein
VKLYPVSIIAIDQEYTGVGINRQEAARKTKRRHERQRCKDQKEGQGNIMFIMQWSGGISM